MGSLTLGEVVISNLGVIMHATDGIDGPYLIIPQIAIEP